MFDLIPKVRAVMYISCLGVAKLQYIQCTLYLSVNFIYNVLSYNVVKDLEFS